MGENTDGKWGKDTDRIREPGLFAFSGVFREVWPQVRMFY